MLASLGLLIVIHEFGHFMFARLFKTRVEKFYLFFDPWFSLFKKKVGDTEYGIGWIPLGGYCKISGMIDESMDKEALKQPPQPYEFRSKKPWQRLLIMIGGVLMNFLLAFIIYIGVTYAWGKTYLPNEALTYGVMVTDEGAKMGFRTGDKIVSLDGMPCESFDDIYKNLLLNDVRSIQVLRDGTPVDIPFREEDIATLINQRPFSPRPLFACLVGDEIGMTAGLAGIRTGDSLVSVDSQQFQFYDQFQDYLKSRANQTVSLQVLRNGVSETLTPKISDDGKLGIGIVFSPAAFDYIEMKTMYYSFAAAIPAGLRYGWQTLGDYVKQLRLMVMPKTKAYKQVGGFIRIGSIFPAQWSWEGFWRLTALLSVMLAVLNLLPIPALDGGHVMFLLYEIITRRKPSDKFMEYAQMTGMALLLLLLIYANGNDILSLF
jgi:regulator of sigma E protease